ncbi:MAG: UDP-N-acetylmuramoyl-tripeptide--D-alanyl-D-alanine ligase [Terriglobia bacterium]
MRLSTAEISTILHSPSNGGPEVALGYSIDSRTLHAGDLFFALRGPRHDGHEFVAAAFANGAVAAVVEHGFQPPAPRFAPSLIFVPDTTRALQQVAAAARQIWAGRVVGITGSTGKTTTKEMTAAALSAKFCVLKSEGNLNNQYGVPLTLLRLEPRHEVAVLELAMSAAGEIARLAEITRPEVGVVTNVAPAHLEFFDSVDAIARAKRELIEHLQLRATAVLNQDDERVRAFAQGFDGRVVTFGLTEGASFRGLNVRPPAPAGNGGFTTEFEVQGGRYCGTFTIPAPGIHNVENALAAIAVASVFEVPREDLRSALASFRTLCHRAEIRRLPGGAILIDDGYNSNPLAMRRMLETLGSWPGAARRIVLAGEMLELGPSSPELHRGVGRECVRAGVDWLIAVGGDARFFIEGAIAAGLPPQRARFFEESAQAGQFCEAMLRTGDVVLVKGSRRVGLEKAVEAITQEQRKVTSDR